MRKTNPIYDVKRDSFELANEFSDWAWETFVNQRGAEDIKIGNWQLEIDPNVSSTYWVKVLAENRHIVLYATPWWYDKSPQSARLVVQLSRSFEDDSDDSGEYIWQKTIAFPKSGDFRKDYQAYLKAMPPLLKEAERVFAEIGEQPMKRWSQERSDKWDEFIASLKVGDTVSFKPGEAPEDATSGTGPAGVDSMLTHDQVLDLFQKAKAEPDEKRREQLMKQVRNAANQLENCLEHLVSALLEDND